MWLFKKKEVKRPSRMYAAIRLAHMLTKADEISYGMALCLAIHHVTRNYDNWTKADDLWFWQNLKADEESLTQEAGKADAQD